MNKWSEIIIHHSFSPDHDTLDYDNIKKWHTVDNGWRDIGYHYVIDTVEGSLVIIKGRSMLMSGAHCKGHNKHGIGICIVGNFDKKKPTAHVYNKVVELCIDLMYIFDISKKNIKPHSEYSDKTCPGKLFNMNEILTRII